MAIQNSTTSVGGANAYPGPAFDNRLVAFDNFDPSALAGTMQGANFNRVQLDAGCFSGQIVRVRCNSAEVVFGNYNKTLLTTGNVLGDQLMMAVAIPRDVKSDNGNGPVFNTARLSVLPPRSSVFSPLPALAKLVAVNIPPEKLELFGLKLPPKSSDYALDVATVRAVSQILHRLAPALQNAANENIQGTLIDGADRIIALMMEFFLKNQYSERTLISSQHRYKLVQSSCELLASLAGDEVNIGNVCRDIGVPIYTLERAFRDVIGVTPRRYLTLERLSRVRRDIIKEYRGADRRSVTDIALNWGFLHLGRFSGQYKGHFGELPSATGKSAQQRCSVSVRV